MTGGSIGIGAALTTGNLTLGNASATTGAVILQSGATSETIKSGGDTIKTTTNSASAFVIQNSGPYNVFSVDTSGDQLKVYDGTATQAYVDIAYSDATSTGTIAASTGITAIGNGTGAITVSAGTAAAVNITANALSAWQTTAGSLSITGAGGLTLTSTGANALALDTSTTGNITIGVNANAKAITVGNSTGGTSVSLSGGTGSSAISIQAATAGSILVGSANANTITLGNNTATTVVSLDSGTATTATQLFNSGTVHNIYLGTSSAAQQTIYIGSYQAGSTTTIQGGTGATAINLIAGNNTTGGTILIGSAGTTTNPDTVDIATSTGAAQIVNIGNDTVTGETLSLGGGNGSTAVAIQADTSGTISLGTANANTVTLGNATAATVFSMESGTGTTALFNGATAHTIQFASGAAVEAVTIGSTNTTSATTIQGGTGNIKLVAAVNTTADGSIIVGSGDGGSGSSYPDLLVVDDKSTTGDPTAVNGAIYYNAYATSGVEDFRCAVQGTWENCLGGLLASNSAVSSVASCTTACSAFSNNAVLAANYCAPGRVITIDMKGVYSVASGTTPTIALGVYYGTSATKASDNLIGVASPAFTTGSGVSNLGWSLDYQIVCYAAGTSVMGEGESQWATSTTATTPGWMYTQTATTFTPTSAENIYVFPAWSASSASNTITADTISITGN